MAEINISKAIKALVPDGILALYSTGSQKSVAELGITGFQTNTVFRLRISSNINNSDDTAKQKKSLKSFCHCRDITWNVILRIGLLFLSVLQAKDDHAHPTGELILCTHIQFWKS